MNRDLPTGSLSLGQRPALIVVDMTNGFVSPESPLGGNFSKVVEVNIDLCNLFEMLGLPILFTSVVYDNSNQATVFRQKLPDLNILQRGAHWTELCPDLQRFNHRELIEKQGASAFYNTSLQQQLRHENVDSLVVTGLTTSGCVRATVVDALQSNYPTFVPAQACADRNMDAHHANLHDMNAKYASVINVSDLIAMLHKRQ